MKWLKSWLVTLRHGSPLTRQGRALRKTARDLDRVGVDDPTNFVEVHRPRAADLPIGTVVHIKPDYWPVDTRVEIRGYDMARTKYRGVPETAGQFPSKDEPGWLWLFPGEIIEVESAHDRAQ